MVENQIHNLEVVGSSPTPAPFYNSKTMSKTTKKPAKKSQTFAAELCTFKQGAMKVNTDEGEVLVKKDSVIAIREIEQSGEKHCIGILQNGPKAFIIKGTYQEIAAKLNWTIDD